ncbi:MAG: 4Fe-4S binding protein [Clostridiales Family XIII bacterium]|nr:4Fe-4S binding protein [Clostridiales Family XIII bacterium]
MHIAIEIVTVIIIALVSGRKFCGKICPLGLLQDLVYKIKFPLKIKTYKADAYLRYLKYLFLVLVFFIRGNEKIEMPPFAYISQILAVIFVSIILSRPFCKYICPWGLALAIGNKIPSTKYKVNTEKCTECGSCAKKCKMDIIPYRQINNVECIYCGSCEKTCPCKAISKKSWLPFVRRQ